MKMVQHKFVEFIPQELEQGILYVSIEYCTAIHLCVCGCGNKVITPIAPTSWQMNFDGKSISLSPSIGNWNFDCQSHYWITNNMVRYAGKWSQKEIKEGRALDGKQKQDYYEDAPLSHEKQRNLVSKQSLIKRMLNYLWF